MCPPALDALHGPIRHHHGALISNRSTNHEDCFVEAASNDFVIIVIGPVGSGKTNFIRTLIGHSDERGASTSLKSGTCEVTPYTVKYGGLRLVLVDTPGFDNLSISDAGIFTLIIKWLAQRYSDLAIGKSTGIIYLRPITERSHHSISQHIRMFRRICGSLSLARARLVTTMWDELDPVLDLKAAKTRESELEHNPWKILIESGAVVKRFDNTPSSAWSIVKDLLATGNDGEEQFLQEELVELRKSLNSGTAEDLYSQLQQLLVDQGMIAQELVAETERQKDSAQKGPVSVETKEENGSTQVEELAAKETKENNNDSTRLKNLQEQYDQTNAQLQKLSEEMEMMKIPMSRRILLWLFGGKYRREHLRVITDDLQPGDIVIVVIGPTGTGKSTFISTASGSRMEGVGPSLKSCTSEVLPVRFWDQESRRHIVLVDTPGFDDTYNTSKSDQILEMISKWLNPSHNKDKVLSGILYLHRISDTRMNSTSLQDLLKFRKVCGQDTFKKVYLTTTMWDEVEKADGERRLNELKTEYWGSLIRQGAHVACCRSDADHPKKLIRDIIFREDERRALLLRQELCEHSGKLKETTGSDKQLLYSQLEKLVEKQLELLHRIATEREVDPSNADPNVLAELLEEYNDLLVQIDNGSRQIPELKLPWFKNVLRLFSSLLS